MQTLIALSPDELQAMLDKSIAAAMKQRPSTPAVEEDEWLTREETAILLKVSLPTLRELEKRKELIPSRIGKRVLYSRKTVEARLRQGMKTQ